jgi:HlyD family secretion protein
MNKLYLFLFFLPFSVLFSCKEKVEKTKPKIANITESVYASGNIKSENQYQVFSKSSGILQQIYVQEGDAVSHNQILFSILNESSSISRENAELLANYNSITNNSEKLNELKINIELAKNKLEIDSMNFIRKRNLHEQKAISDVEFEQSELNYISSKTAFRSAKIKYSELKRQLNFSDQQTKKSLQISQTVENDFVVKSNINGKIFAILKEKGEMVSPQIPLAIIGNHLNYIIELQIDENDISKIEKGQKLILSLDSYEKQTFTGIITKINPFLNEKSKTFLVEAKFIQQPKQLYPNLSLEANIIIKQKKNALLIPRKFLINDTYVQKENAEKVKVKIGLKDYDFVEILSGLTKNETIIVPIK